MFGDNPKGQNRCLDCGLDFDSVHELQNHKRRFCINSGYDNLEGLAKIEWNGVEAPHKAKFSQKNHLQQYGSNSLASIGEHKELTEDNLRRDMRNINKFKQQLEGVKKYKHGEPTQSQATQSSKAKLSQAQLANSFSQSRLDEELKRYQKPMKESAISPPTFIDQLNMRNHTVLDKSNSSLGRMPFKDRIEYAQVKLDELNEIKSLYIQNGGNRAEFKANVDKMIGFYENFLKEQKQKLNEQDKKVFNESQQLIESRCSTPILKLRSFEDNKKQSQASIMSNKRAKTSKANQIKNSVPINNVPSYPQFNGMTANGYPPIIMMPYPPPQSTAQSNDSLRVLEKMLELKSEENKKLLEIMLQDRKKSYPQYPSYPQPSNLPQMSMVEPVTSQSKFASSQKKKVIDVAEDYQFKKSMVDDLISEQKVLLALQQEQLDELKLLSQLPRELQEIKLQSVIKSSDTRFQVEKEILKQKMQRLAYQEENQTFQEDRKIGNDRWAGEERKKLLEQQMGRYLDNFQSQLLSP